MYIYICSIHITVLLTSESNNNHFHTSTESCRTIYMCISARIYRGSYSKRDIPPPPPIHFRPKFHKPSGTPEAPKSNLREPKILIFWGSIHTDSPGAACLV